MRSFWTRFALIIIVLTGISPLASQAEAPASQQLAERLEELKVEYTRIETDITGMSRFIGKAKEDRASIDTLSKFLFRLSVVSKEIDSLSRKADALSVEEKPFAISKIWTTDTIKSEEALSTIAEGEAAYLYLAFNMPKKLEAIDIAFTVVELKSGKKVAAISRTRRRKGAEEAQRTGIKIEPDVLKLGARYEWQANLTSSNGKTVSKKLQFGYGQSVIALEKISLIASNIETGQPLGSDIADDVSIKFEATVPLLESGEGEITWQLIDTSKKPIESKGKVESFSEVGGSKKSTYKLTSKELAPGQYSVSVIHTLKGSSKSKTESTIAFNVMGAINIHKLAVSNSKKGDIASGTLKAGDLPHLFIHYTALKPIKTGSLRIYDANSGKEYYSSDIAERVKADKKPHRIGTRLSADLLPLDREVIFEVRFVDMNDNDIANKRSIRINRHKLDIKLAKQLTSGKEYTFSITPPAGFVSPYTVAYQPSNLIVHESANNPLKGSVTGITEQKKASAGLKIELTDAAGQVAVAYRELMVIGSRQKQPITQPRSIVIQNHSGGDLFSSLWGYKEGDYRNDPIIKQLNRLERSESGQDRAFERCLPGIIRDGSIGTIDSDRALMGKLKEMRKKITKRQTKCSTGEPYYRMSFSLKWKDFPQKTINGYKEFNVSYGASCRPIKPKNQGEYRYLEYDGGYYAEFYKKFTSDDADSVIDMMVMSCLAPSTFLKKFIPEAPTSATKPMGCTSVPDSREGFYEHSCRMPMSELPRKLW